ncbi:MAG: exosortase F system-associated protein [Bacteroidota bacterium]
MLQSKSVKIVVVLFLIGLLIVVRALENTLFYDPFIGYFKAEYSDLPYPQFDSFLFYLNLIFRFTLNSVISVLILYVIFDDISIIKFSGSLLLLFMIVLLFSMFLLLNYSDESQKMILFYVRRFLIQPIFLLLFIPAFYYQKKTA